MEWWRNTILAQRVGTRLRGHRRRRHPHPRQLGDRRRRRRADRRVRAVVRQRQQRRHRPRRTTTSIAARTPSATPASWSAGRTPAASRSNDITLTEQRLRRDGHRHRLSHRGRLHERHQHRPGDDRRRAPGAHPDDGRHPHRRHRRSCARATSRTSPRDFRPGLYRIHVRRAPSGARLSAALRVRREGRRRTPSPPSSRPRPRPARCCPSSAPSAPSPTRCCSRRLAGHRPRAR